MPVETTIEGRAVAKAKSRGWKNIPLKVRGRRGRLDQLFLRDGRAVFIEFKQPYGSLSPDQGVEIASLEKHGFTAAVCDTVDGALAVLREHE